MYRCEWDLVDVPNLQVLYEGQSIKVDIAHSTTKKKWIASLILPDRVGKDLVLTAEAVNLSQLATEIRRKVDMWLRSDRPSQEEADLCGISGLVEKRPPVPERTTLF